MMANDPKPAQAGAAAEQADMAATPESRREQGRRNLNRQIAQRQQLLLVGVGAIALIAGATFLFGGDDAKQAGGTGDPVTIDTGGLVNRNLSEREFVATYGNRADAQDREIKALKEGQVPRPELEEQLAALKSENAQMRTDGQHALRPSFGVAEPGEAPRIHFAGIPMGHEFSSLVLALLQVGGNPVKEDAALIDQPVGDARADPHAEQRQPGGCDEDRPAGHARADRAAPCQHRAKAHQHRPGHRPAHLAFAVKALEFQLAPPGGGQKGAQEHARHQPDFEIQHRVFRQKEHQRAGRRAREGGG